LEPGGLTYYLEKAIFEDSLKIGEVLMVSIKGEGINVGVQTHKTRDF